ncbi:MAG: cytochrome P450 [Anaerolineae bacterium]|nr:cytochrome P450 [Anaerolineae bacterium]MBN8618270.1 cytochrome P450 [Anaerolineae bacterium]
MQFDPLSLDFQLNPYPYYDQLRQASPILYHQDWDLWFFTTFDDVNTLLRDRRLGRTMDHIISREERGLPPPSPEYAPFRKLGEHSMFDKEPPDHTRLRSLVHKVFTPRRVENLRQQIQQIANDLLDKVQPNGEMDILEDFSTPLPVTVIGELLGVPPEDRHLLRPWSQDIVAMYELNHTPEQAQRAVKAAIDFSDYLRQLANNRRQHPQDDLITALALVEEAGDQLSEDELISTCVLLLNAGHEATVNVVGNGLLALFHHPEQFALLKSNPQLIKTAIEELMRYDTPLQLFRRWVLEDMEYKGHHFKQGMQFGLMFGAANRDPARFVNANSLDITREDNPHISFGGGVHYCLGAPLARLELEIAFETLLRRMPNMQLKGGEPEFRPTYVIRGLKALPVTF